MSLTLDLKPEEEMALRTYASAEGVTPDQFIARLLKGYQPPAASTDAEPAWKAKLKAGQQIMSRAFIASGKTDDEMAADVDAEIKAYRAEQALAQAGPLPRSS